MNYRARHHHLPWFQGGVAFPQASRPATESLAVPLFYMGSLMDCQMNLQSEALPTVRAQERLLPRSGKDTRWLAHSLCCSGLPNPHPRHSLGTMLSEVSSLIPGPLVDSIHGLAWGLQKVLLRVILRWGFCFDGHSITTWQNSHSWFQEDRTVMQVLFQAQASPSFPSFCECH